MFWWLFGKKRVKRLEEKTEEAFSGVKKDFESVSKWVKHLDGKDKQLFDLLNSIRGELSSINEELGALRESSELVVEDVQNKQLSKKTVVLNKQTAVYGVQNAVQTAVQSGNFYDFLKGLSANERLVVLTLANSDMKLSYEDLAMLLGKERSTIRGQINSIKQKSEGREIIEEIIEKNGKKRVFVPENIREKLSKYAKVRVRGSKKSEKDEDLEEIE